MAIRDPEIAQTLAAALDPSDVTEGKEREKAQKAFCSPLPFPPIYSALFAVREVCELGWEGAEEEEGKHEQGPYSALHSYKDTRNKHTQKDRPNDHQQEHHSAKEDPAPGLRSRGAAGAAPDNP